MKLFAASCLYVLSCPHDFKQPEIDISLVVVLVAGLWVSVMIAISDVGKGEYFVLYL